MKRFFCLNVVMFKQDSVVAHLSRLMESCKLAGIRVPLVSGNSSDRAPTMMPMMPKTR